MEKQDELLSVYMAFEEMKEKFSDQAKEMFYYKDKAAKSDEKFSREYAEKNAIAAINVWNCIEIMNRNVGLVPTEALEQTHKELLQQAKDKALDQEKTISKKHKKERAAGGR